MKDEVKGEVRSCPAEAGLVGLETTWRGKSMRRSSVCQNEGSGPFCDVEYDFLVGVTRVTRASKPRLAVLISAVFMSVMFMYGTRGGADLC